jgi:hypothetical protein
MRKIAQNLLKAYPVFQTVFVKQIFKSAFIGAWPGNGAGPKIWEAAAKGRAREEV